MGTPEEVFQIHTPPRRPSLRVVTNGAEQPATPKPSTISAAKRRYRRLIAELAFLDDAAPVKKERPIECYNQARSEEFTERVIRGGWKAAGIAPWNPAKALESSQLQDRRPLPSIPTKQANQGSLELFTTPQNLHQAYQTIQSLDKAQKLSREGRTALRKASKANSVLNELNKIQ